MTLHDPLNLIRRVKIKFKSDQKSKNKVQI